MINSISILFVTRDPDLAGQIIGRIRYRGHAVRPKQAGNVRDLARLLQSHRFDALVLIDSNLDIGLAEVSEALHRAGRQTPVVLVSDHGQEQSLRAIDSGIFAVVGSRSDDLAAVMTLRAVDHLNKGREVTHLRTLLREADRRYLLMLDTSRYPIACFHQGIATYANESWRDFFEMDLGESLDQLTLNDLVVPEQQEDLQEILGELRNQSENVETCETLTVRTRQGRSFDADLLLTGAVINSEPSIVVHVSVAGEDPALQGPGGFAIPSAPDRGDLEQLGEAPGERDARQGPNADSRSDGRGSPAGTGAGPPAATRQDDAASEQELLRDTDAMQAEAARSGRSLGLLVFAPDALEPGQGARSEIPGNELQDLLQAQFPDPAGTYRLREGQLGVLLPGSARDELEERIGAALKSASGLNIRLGDGSGIGGTLSCGVVLADDSGPEAGELLEQARESLAEARNAGGNQYRFHALPGAAGADPKADQIWKSRIEQAVRDDRLRLLYQPIVSLQGEDVPRYNVFLRLTGEDGAVHEPQDFLPPAERTGTAAPLDRWVIQQAIKVLAGELKRDDRTVFFLKLSQGSLDGEPVVDWLRRALDRHKVPAANVVVEFREATLLTQPDSAAAVASGLGEMGVGLCIGDFGNGLEPFRILDQVDAAFIRLDGSFVNRLTQDQEAQGTVRELTETAKSRDRQVIMPMVEDADTLTAVFSMEVNLVQGYFVQPPSEQLDFDFASGL
ncbi:EAL domain-containing protein [Thioalkalivibrio sp.]|uniref:EAL domain-containing protein n=1 Tax=Thioalkalivibrio sp. TaxID=2093813 RepID=UPI00356A710D